MSTADRPTTEPRTDSEMAEYVRSHQCWNADPNVTIADWHRGILAIEAEAAQGAAPRAEGLDVPRLTQAMGNVMHYKDWRDEYPEQVAAEYARLSRPSDEREGADR